MNLVPVYYYNKNLKRVQTTYVEHGSKVIRYRPDGERIFTANNTLRECEFIVAIVANDSKNFFYFTGKK